MNLTRLGDALAPLLSDTDEVIVGAIDHFRRRYAAERAEVFRAKLGLPQAAPAAAIAALADDLLALLEVEGTDATVFFRALADAERGDLTAWHAVLDVVRRPFSLRSDVPDEYRFGAPAGSAAYVTYCGT